MAHRDLTLHHATSPTDGRRGADRHHLCGFSFDLAVLIGTDLASASSGGGRRRGCGAVRCAKKLGLQLSTGERDHIVARLQGELERLAAGT